jgi:hypothetical protein
MCPAGRTPIVDSDTDEHQEATVSTTVPAPTGRAVAPRRVGRLLVAALFAVMAALLVAAVLVALLAGPGPDRTPRPAPAPAPALSR